MMRTSFIFILLLVFTLGCSTNEEEPISIETFLIAKGGTLSGLGREDIEQQDVVITDETTWNELITKMDSYNNQSKRFSETDIDFSKYKIIAVFDRLRNNGSIAIELAVIQNLENIIIRKNYVVPASGMASNNHTQPYHIIKITNTDLPIVFEDGELIEI